MFSLVSRQVETFDVLKYHWMAYSPLLPKLGATILPLLHPGLAHPPVLRTWFGSFAPPTNLVRPARPLQSASIARHRRRRSSSSFYPTVYLYYATFTTLLLYYSTFTTHSCCSIATAVVYEDRLLPPLLLFTCTTPPSLLYYFTTSLLLRTSTTSRFLLDSFTAGRLVVSLVIPVVDASGVARRGLGLWRYGLPLLPVGPSLDVAPSGFEWTD